jgi:hypothetical protein
MNIFLHFLRSISVQHVLRLSGVSPKRNNTTSTTQWKFEINNFDFFYQGNSSRSGRCTVCTVGAEWAAWVFCNGCQIYPQHIPYFTRAWQYNTDLSSGWQQVLRGNQRQLIIQNVYEYNTSMRISWSSRCTQTTWFSVLQVTFPAILHPPPPRKMASHLFMGKMIREK